jgi:hypothetical protein
MHEAIHIHISFFFALWVFIKSLFSALRNKSILNRAWFVDFAKQNQRTRRGLNIKFCRRRRQDTFYGTSTKHSTVRSTKKRPHATGSSPNNISPPKSASCLCGTSAIIFFDRGSEKRKSLALSLNFTIF